MMIRAGYIYADEGFDVNASGINYVHFGVLDGKTVRELAKKKLINKKQIELFESFFKADTDLKDSEVLSVAFGVETSDGRILASSPTGKSTMMIFTIQNGGEFRKSAFTSTNTMFSKPTVTSSKKGQPGKKVFHSIADPKKIFDFGKPQDGTYKMMDGSAIPPGIMK